MAIGGIISGVMSAVGAQQKQAEGLAADINSQWEDQYTDAGSNAYGEVNPYAPFQPGLGYIAGGVEEAMRSPWQLPDQTYAGRTQYQNQGRDVGAGALQNPWTMGQGAPGLSRSQGAGMDAVYNAASGTWELPDQTLAGVDPYQRQGVESMAGLSGPQGPLGQISSQTQQAYSGALDPNQFMNAPGAYAPLDNYANEVGRNLREQGLPGIQQQATAVGHGGSSSRAGIAEGLAQRGASEAISRYGQQLTGQLANQGLQARNQAIGQAGSVQDVSGAGSRNLLSAGGINRDFAQQAFDDARMRQEFRQTEGLRRGGALLEAGGVEQESNREQLLDQRERDMFAQAEGVGRGEALSGIGDREQALNQGYLDDQRMRQDFQNREPFERLGAGAEIAYGGAQLGGTTVNDETSYQDVHRDFRIPPPDPRGMGERMGLPSTPFGSDLIPFGDALGFEDTYRQGTYDTYNNRVAERNEQARIRAEQRQSQGFGDGSYDQAPLGPAEAPTGRAGIFGAGGSQAMRPQPQGLPTEPAAAPNADGTYGAARGGYDEGRGDFAQNAANATGPGGPFTGGPYRPGPPMGPVPPGQPGMPGGGPYGQAPVKPGQRPGMQPGMPGGGYYKPGPGAGMQPGQGFQSTMPERPPSAGGTQRVTRRPPPYRRAV